MHEANRKFFLYMRQKYLSRYENNKNVRILECGSLNVNGSIRNCMPSGNYIGVDWREGPCVDMVCLTHEMQFNEQFDIVASASMLEHDPYWEKSISKMLDYLKEDGIMILTWGAARNPPHEHGASDDNCFHKLPAGYVINYLKDRHMYIHEFRYEGLLPFVNPDRDCCSSIPRGMGEVCLVCFKNKNYAPNEPPILDTMLEEDMVD